jgi:MazG family protein
MTEPPPEAADAERAEGAARSLARLDAITRRLRRECPWDREQDERSIVPHTVEEAYELADAAASGDDAKLLDELGDVLFQVHFLALLAEERGAGDLAAVADGMTEKLIRRHPHVFGEAEARDAGQVLANWDRIKREREGRDGLFEDVPENLPALLLARKLQRRAASRPELAGPELGPVGADDHAAVLARVRGALAELEAAAADPGASAGPAEPDADRDRIERAIGEVLFEMVDVARRLRCDPELALRAAAGRFRELAGEVPPAPPS